MRLLSLTAKNYRSLRDVTVDLGDLNLFIGANGSGKSAILDVLRFLQEGIQTYDFRSPVFSRGGFSISHGKVKKHTGLNFQYAWMLEMGCMNGQLELLEVGMTFMLKKT